MARNNNGKLIRVERTTASGSKYFEKVRQDEAGNKSRSQPESSVVTSPKASPRSKA